MSTRSKTERGEYVFAVKEFGDGTPWVMLEPVGEKLNILGNGFLGLDFQEGVSLKEAEKIAGLLRDKISTISFTSFPD